MTSKDKTQITKAPWRTQQTRVISAPASYRRGQSVESPITVVLHRNSSRVIFRLYKCFSHSVFFRSSVHFPDRRTRPPSLSPTESWSYDWCSTAECWSFCLFPHTFNSLNLRKSHTHIFSRFTTYYFWCEGRVHLLSRSVLSDHLHGRIFFFDLRTIRISHKHAFKSKRRWRLLSL